MDSNSNVRTKSRRKRIEKLSLEQRLLLLRGGYLSEMEIADFVAEAGSSNYIEAMADVERLLDHPSEIVRYGAMSALAYEWGVCSRVDRIIEIALKDPDGDCRRQAVGALGSLHRESKQRELIDLLVLIAKDTREADDVRAFAYTAVLDVMGVPRKVQPNPLHLEIGPNELAALDEYLRRA